MLKNKYNDKMLMKVNDVFMKNKNEILENYFYHLKFEKTNEELTRNIYLECKDLIYGSAFSILKNKLDTEDVVQIVFTKIFSMNKEKLPEKYIKSWLYTVTKNETLMYLRQKKTVNIDIDSIYNIADNNNQIDDFIDKDSYSRMISGLDEKEKEIVSLKIIADMPFSEISNLLKEPTATIKWRYYKAIKSLRIAIGNIALSIGAFLLNKYLTIKPSTNNNIPEFESSLITNNTKENISISNMFLIISIIFLIFGLIFLLFYLKHQLKRHKTASK